MFVNVRMPEAWLQAALTVLVIVSPAALADPPDTITLPITPRYQQASQLCWAATSQMAVESLVNPPLTGPKVNQPLLAAYNQEGIGAGQLRLGNVTDLQIQNLQQRLPSCSCNIFQCSKPGDPILVGLQYATPTSDKLRIKDIKEQLGTLQRPFIFSWQFKAGPGGAPSGNYHYLMAVGYDATDSRHFRLVVWDPWPVPSPGSPDPTSADFKSISFKTYKNPAFDNSGLYSTYLQTWSGFEPVANHPAIPPAPLPSDSASACGTNTATPIASNPVAGTGGILRPDISPVDFERALTQSLSDTQRTRKLKEINGWLKTNTVIGRAVPIATLSLDELRDMPAALRRLRAHQTYIVLYPVSAGEKIVDSFLMVRGFWGWKERGYANNEITRRLVNIRATSETRGRVRPGEFYYVSIPQLRAFFGAYDRDGRTRLISTTTDPSIGVLENEEVFADEVLARIARSIGRVDH